METSRQRVLEFIRTQSLRPPSQRNPLQRPQTTRSAASGAATVRAPVAAQSTARGVTASDVSRVLKMTLANAQHHLRILESEGAIVAAGTRPGPGKGRPARLFVIAPQAGAHNLAPLSAALLGELDLADPELRRRLAERMLSGRTPPQAGLTLRLGSAVETLNAHHYQAHWEAHAAGPRLVLGRCPYAPLPGENPSICKLDQAILERLVGAPLQPLVVGQEGGCVFLIA